MSQLPPRPTFDFTRNPPHNAEPRSYGRGPPPPSDPYHGQPRDREGYRGTPPRPKGPPRGDSYVVADSYGSRGPYPPPPDRYDEDRYRSHGMRDWERRDRDYPPYQRGEPRNWRDRDRRWEDDRGRYEYERDRRDRDRSPARERDRPVNWARARDDERGPGRARARPPTPERTWVPRPSKSPPRRVGDGSAPPSRPRSPSPRTPPRSPQSPPRRPRSPTSPRSLYASLPSPAPRAVTNRDSPPPSTPGKQLKLGNHSISVSPGQTWQSRPYAEEDHEREREQDRDSDRDRHWNQRKSRRSRSPSRSSSRARVAPRRSLSPKRRDTRRSPSPAYSERERDRERSRRDSVTARSTGRVRSRSRTPRRNPTASPPKRSADLRSERSPQRREPTDQRRSRSRETKRLTPPPAMYRKPLPTGPRSQAPAHESVPMDVDPPARPTPTQPRKFSPPHVIPMHLYQQQMQANARAMTSPSSPQVQSPSTPLPHRPEWLSGQTATKGSMPAPGRRGPSSSVVEQPVRDVEMLPEVPPIPKYTRPSSAPELVSSELARIIARRERVTVEHETAERASRRAVHEYMTTYIDLQFAIKKRKIADAQLELAKVGMLGYDYKPVESLADASPTSP